MARISLLFSLAFVLALGSLFLSVSGHAPPALPRKPSCPKTVSELQTLPFTEIIEILNRKERLAPKTTEFKAMFTMCKGYVAYLESLYKFENPIVDVLGIAKSRYALMTKAILAAQASVSSKANNKTSLKLKKSSADLTKGFLQIKETIVKISAKHQFKADAKITAHESKKLNHAMIYFKNSIKAFMNVICNLEKKKMKKIVHHARVLEEGQNGDKVRNAWDKFFRKFGGYLGGKTHGRELTEVEFNANSHGGADVKGFEAIYEKFSHFFGGNIGGKAHGRELYVVTPTDAAAPTGEKVKDVSSSMFDKYFGGKAHGRELYVVSTPTNAAAPTGEKVKDVSSSMFDKYFGGKAHGRELYVVTPTNAAAPTGEKDKDVSMFDKYFGGKAHGRELYVLTPDKVNAAAPAEANADLYQSVFDKYFYSYFGDKSHGRELYVVAPDDAAAPAEANADISQSVFDKYFYSYYGDKSHGRELTEAKVGVNAGAQAGGKVKGSFGNFLNVGFGGKVLFDAAGKMKVAGEDGFKSLNRAHYKKFVSTKA